MCKHKQIVIHVRPEPPRPPAEPPRWFWLLVYLTWLRAIRPPRPFDSTVLLAFLVLAGLVLVCTVLVLAGAPELVKGVVQSWPRIGP